MIRIVKYGSLNFWPEDWFCSFKLHCIPRFWLLRHFLVPQMPKDKPGLEAIMAQIKNAKQNKIFGFFKK